jgi:hypothetical protein
LVLAAISGRFWSRGVGGPLSLLAGLEHILTIALVLTNGHYDLRGKRP